MGQKLLIFFLLIGICFASSFTRAKTYRTSVEAAVFDRPNGDILEFWQKGTVFTSNIADGMFVKITGFFPNAKWQPAPNEWWVNSSDLIDISPAAPIAKPAISSRYIVVEKSKFLLKVIEQIGEKEFEVFTTKVGLGIDGCKSEAKGGKCYYTLPGEYKVEFKVYDADGIEWCIPKSMEDEYRADIDAGNRCFRGSLGKYALNIGNSYAIHGTSNPASIGKKISHGCIRVLNSDAKYLYRLMQKDDKVIIID